MYMIINPYANTSKPLVKPDNPGTTKLDGRNSQKYLHQTKAELLILIISHKLSQNL